MAFNPQTGLFEPFALAQPTGAPQSPQIPQLQPQESDSLLQSLTGKAMSGLGYIGGSLDKMFGGRALRGLLGGRPEEALSLIPFSDTLGITDEKNRVSGEDLAKQWGLLEGEGEKGSFEMRDLLGPALEIGLDPATYLSFGGSALSKAGQAAKKAGSLEATLGGRIRAGQAGLAGLGLPFTEPSALLGTGATGAKIGDVLGGIGSGIATSYPGRALKALFNKNVEGTTSAVLQPELEAAAARANPRVAAMKEALGKQSQLLGNAGEITPQTSDIIRAAMENNLSPLPGTATGGVSEAMQRMEAEQILREANAGMPVNAIEGHAPRQMTPLDKATAGYAKPAQPMSPFTPNQLGREDYLNNANITGGTLGINELLKDPALRQSAIDTPLAAQQSIREGYLGMKPVDDALLQQLRDAKAAGTLGGPTDILHAPLQYSQDLLRDLESKQSASEGLSKLAGTIDPQYAQKGLDFFGNNIFSDVGKRLERGIRAEEKATGFQNAISKIAIPADKALPNAVPVTQVLKDAGLTEMAHKGVMQKMGITNADEFMKLRVPMEQAQELTKYVQGFSKPEAISPLLSAFDSITKLTKAGVTSIWPSKYSRDFLQGIWMNWVHDGFDPAFSKLDPRAWLKPYQDAKTVLREGGGVLQDANKIKGLEKLSPEEATQKLAAEMYARNIGGPEKLTGAVESAGGIHAAEKEIIPPGSAKQPTLAEIMKGGVTGLKENWNPLDIAGVGGRERTTFAPAKAGSQVMEMIDDMNRGSIYIAKRRQGFLPDAAAEVANKAQYDYGNLSKFERSTMQRVAPFYNFMRQNIPATLEQLIEKPGGKVGAAIKGEEALRHDQGFVPDYIGEGLALPLGKEEDGQQRFLSRFGVMPHEAAFEDIGVGPNAAQRTLQNVLSETNPLIKAPLELAAGKQFYSGRDLQDLSNKGLTGNTLIDQAIMNSPLSRFATSARTALDERKGIGAKALNLLTPAKVTDVDLEKARSIAGRQLIEEQLKQNPNVQQFERLFVKPENLPNLNARDVELLRLYQTMQAQGKKVGVKKPGGP